MRKPYWLFAALVVGGIFLGWYGLINFQLSQQITLTAKANQAQANRLQAVEDLFKPTDQKTNQ